MYHSIRISQLPHSILFMFVERKPNRVTRKLNQKSTTLYSCTNMKIADVDTHTHTHVRICTTMHMHISIELYTHA